MTARTRHGAARLTFLASAVLYAVVVAVGGQALPGRVPLHFGTDGAPDRFGTRAELLTTQAAVGTGVVALLALVALGMRHLPLAWVKVPHPGYWKAPAREAELRRRMEADTLVIGTGTLLLLAAVSALTTHAALTGAGLGAAAVVVVVAYGAGILGYCAWMTLGRYRPPDRAAAPVTRS